MRVTKTPTDVEFTNVFGEPYKVVFEESQTPDLEYVQEEVVSLAEDIIEHERALDLLAERTYSVEEVCFGVDGKGGLKKAIETIKENQITDVENLSATIDIVGCMQEANRMMLDVIVEQDEQIKVMKDEIKGVDNAGICLFWFLVLWNVVLTVLFGIYVF